MPEFIGEDSPIEPSNPEKKRCMGCKRWKLVTEFYHDPRPGYPPFRARCKQCYKLQAAEQRERDKGLRPATIKARAAKGMRKWREEHRDEYNAYRRENYRKAKRRKYEQIMGRVSQ